MKNIYVILNKISLIILFSLFTTTVINGQCPTAPATCTNTVTSSTNQTAGFTLAANQTLCIQSGTYSGFIGGLATTATIYVAPGATFNPTGINGFAGRLVNCGTMTLPSFNLDNAAGLARIENYGVATVNGGNYGNNFSTWINGLGSKMTFNNNLTLNNINFTNNGNVLLKGTLTINTNAINIFTNHDSLTALGNISLNSRIYNDGYVFAKGSDMTLNATGNISNKCYFKADGNFTINTSDTLLIDGFLWATGKATGTSLVKIQGSGPVKLGPDGFLQGLDFQAASTPILGNGDFRFTGVTRASATHFGIDGNGLNFYDTGLPTGVFDQLDNGASTFPSVTKTPIAARDSTFIPNTCSPLIRCNTPNGGAGNDTLVCGASINLKDANPADPFYFKWSAEPGNPSAATIDAVTGITSGMTNAGDYYFRLFKFTNPSCYDIVKVTVTTPPTDNLTVVGDSVCRTATNATVRILNAQSNVTYEAYKGTTLLATASGPSASLNILIPVSTLTDGANTIAFKAKRPSCGTVNLINSAIVVVSPLQDANVSVTASSPVCSGGTSTVTINPATAGITYTIRDKNNMIIGSVKAATTGSLQIITSSLTATIGPDTNTFTVTASVAKCADVVLTGKPKVVVNPSQDLAADVSVVSPICSNNTSNVTIEATKGITYTIRDQNNVVLGTATATATGNLVIPTIVLSATGTQSSRTLTITAEVAGCTPKILNNKPTILVNPLLVPSVSIATATSTICAGTTVLVTATPVNPGTSPTYQWKINGVNVGAPVTSNTFSRNTFAQGDVVSVEMTSNAICATPAKVSSSSNITMTVNPLLTPSVSIATGNTTICAGTSVTVTATPVNGGAAPTYQWKVNGTNVGANTSANTFTSTTLANSDVISVVLTSNATCATPTTATSTANITMTVNPNEVPAVSIATPATTVCSGSEVTFTATPVHGGTAPTYQWRVNNVNVNGATGSTFSTSTLVNNDEVTVVMTSNETCRTTNTATSNIIKMNIGTNLVPTVSITTPALTVCAGSPVVFTATVANGGAGPTFQWKVNGTNAGAVTTSKTFTRSNLVDGDQVSVTLTSNETCVITNTAVSNVITIKVNPVQPAGATVKVVSPICHNGTSTMTISATKGMTYTVRDQNLNIVGTGTAAATGDINITIGPLTAPNGPTSYTLTVTATIVGCSDVVLTQKPVVLVNPAQGVGVTVSANSPICSGESSNIVALFATEGITYTVVDENTNDTLGRGTAVANGNLNITTKPLFATEPTLHTYKIIATVGGCAPVTLSKHPQVLVNPVQDKAATVTAQSPICSGESSVVTIQATKGIKYTIKDQNGIVIGSDSALVSGPFKITTSALVASSSGPTSYTFTITASVNSCDDVVLNGKPIVIVNPIQNIDAKVTARSPICHNTGTTVTIAATNGITYTVYDQNNVVRGTRKSTVNGNITINTTPVFTAVGGPVTYTLRVVASVDSCDDVILKDRPVVVVNPAQDPAADVVATSPVCSGDSSTITIQATKGITYTVTNKSNGFVLAKDSATITGSISFNTSALTATVNPTLYTLVLNASAGGCTTVKLTKEPVVAVNKTPSAIIATGGVICSNTDSATITLVGVEKNVSYQAFKGGSPFGNPVIGLANTIRIPNTPPLPLGNNDFTIKGTVGGCPVIDVDTARVIINKLPPDTISFTADNVICAGNNTTIRLKNTPQAGVTYTVIDVFNNVSTTLGTLNAIGAGSYALNQVGEHTIKIKASILGCAVVDLQKTQTVLVNKRVEPVDISGIPTGPICENNNNVTLTITNAIEAVDYNIFEDLSGTLILVNKTGPITSVNPSYTITNIAVGSHIYQIRAKIGGCDTSNVGSFSVTVDKNVDTLTPKVDAGARDVCFGSTSTVSVSVSGTQEEISYQLQRNGVNISTPQTPSAAGQTLTFGPFNDLLADSVYVFSVTGTNTGCGTVAIAAKDTVFVSDSIRTKGPELVADTNVICVNDKAGFSLFKTQKGVTYRLYNDGVLIDSARAVKNSDTLFYKNHTLTVGIHTFTVDAYNEACANMLETKDTIKVNGLPRADSLGLSANHTVLCNNDSLFVKVFVTKNSDYSYYLIDSYNNTVKVLGTSKSGNSDTLTFGGFTQLGEGIHNIRVVSTVQGCASDTSTTFLEIKINNSLDVDKPIITADKNVICENGSVTISITNTSKGDKYTLSRNNILVTGAGILNPQESMFDGDTLVYGPISGLADTVHIFTATTTNPGCGTYLLKDTAKVIVNPIPSQNTRVQNNSPICLGDVANFKVDTLKNVTYTLYKMVDSSFVDGPAKEFLKTAPYAKSGLDSLFVLASIAGCADVRLEPNQYITINQVPNINLISDTLSTCLGSGLSIPLLVTDPKWKYLAHVTVNGKDTTVARQGNDTLSFAFDGAFLAKQGFYPVSFEVDGTGTGCPNTSIINSGGIRVIDTVDGLHGNNAICEARAYDYSIPLVPGVLGYVFDVFPANQFDSTLLSPDSIRVTWNADVKKGLIVAYPITNTGVCKGYGDSLNINIEKPYDGKANVGLDYTIVCVGQRDTISIENLNGGVPKYDRSINKAIVTDSIIKPDPKDNKYIVRYNEAGTVVHRYTITSACAGTIDIVDTSVVVLPIPQVSVGEYPVILMKDYPREVVLDGSASSKGNFLYKWTIKPAGSVTNSNAIMASFVPEQTITQVKLTVTNANGMCPNSDSTQVVVDLGIFIPNVFTPNNDGDHDNWYLENVMAFYPNVKVDIYSKWGTLVYHSDGYPKPWDGTRDAQELPAATYYYVIDLKKPNFKPIAGSVTIIR